MGKKTSGSQKKKDGSRRKVSEPEDLHDDDIDVFHKQRDIVPLDLNDDFGDSSDDDDEIPVLEHEDIRDDTSDDEEDDEEDDDDDDANDKGLVGKMARTLKHLQEKFPGVDDEMGGGDDEDEDEEKSTWAREKGSRYGGDNRDIELDSSDEEELKEEEEEVVRLQKKKAKSLSMADFGIDDASENESDQELSLEQISNGKKTISKGVSTEESTDPKDLNSLSREEQMNIVYSSAPELVGLLSELNDADEQLKTIINPVLDKAKESGLPMDGGLRFLEDYQTLLMAYCQVISFYLLLMSEGQPVHDHPVIEQLVKTKGLLDKMKQLGGDIPSKLEGFLKENISTEALDSINKKEAAAVLASDISTKECEPSLVSADTQKAVEVMLEGKSSSDHLVKEVKQGSRKRKNLQNQQTDRLLLRKQNDDEIGVESTEMLRIRAALEEKLKQKGVFSLVSPDEHYKGQKKAKPVNGRLETRDDFDDDTGDIVNGNQAGKGKQTNLYSKKLKVISGDEDIPRRDDIGERRRKHEMRVLATAQVKSSAGEDDDDDDGEPDDVQDDDASDEEDESDGADESSEDDEELEDAKPVAKKSDKRNTAAVTTPSVPETLDGKRLITYQMEKNRGLTRKRKKLIKNPRKKYRLKHQSAEKRRKGQVVSIKLPSGPYGGEASGINPGISRSVRM
ncbi:Protein THALLO [Linum perenne]